MREQAFERELSLMEGEKDKPSGDHLSDAMKMRQTSHHLKPSLGQSLYHKKS